MSDSDDEFVMKFNAKKGKKEEGKKDKEGIMGLKFMKKAEQRQKEQLKEDADMLIRQLNEDAASSGDEAKGS
jgi:U3 small nucleolar RNA-associated protein 14